MRPILLACLSSTFLSVLAGAQTPRTTTVLSGGPSFGIGGIASEGPNIVTYFNNAGLVYVSRSADCGASWGPLVRLDADPLRRDKFSASAQDDQTVHIHGDHVYATWMDRRSIGTHLYFARSTDGGASFQETLLDDGASGIIDSVVSWVMTVEEQDGDPTLDRIYVLVLTETEVSGYEEDLFLVTSQDGGASFGSAVPVSPLNGAAGVDVDSIALAARGAELAIAWSDDRNGSNDVFFTTSPDGGVSFQAAVELNGAARSANGQVRLAVEGDTLALIWLENAPGSGLELHLRHSTDFGSTFGADTTIGGYTPSVDTVSSPFVALADGTIACAWMDDRTGELEAYVATSSDGGQSFTETRLSEGRVAGLSFFALESAFGAAWRNRSSVVLPVPNPLHVRTSEDAGATWAPPVGIDVIGGDLRNITLLRDEGDGAVVAWLSNGDPLSGGKDTFVTGFNTTAATVADRSPAPNPASYVSLPVLLGGTWSATVDLSTTGHAAAQILVFAAPAATVLPQGDLLLVGGPRLLQTSLLPGPLASFSASIPNDVCLSGFTAYSQAVHLGGVSPFRLTNAQDLTVGTF